MDIWGIDFYPTPQEVVERMLSGVDVAGKFVLEPSAGSGNIVDMVRTLGAADVIACEIDPRLRKVLAGKCTIVAEDFMQVTREQVSHVDLIVMNPPFSRAADHILHAYDIAPDGCEIISLCNSDMLCGYTTNKRKILELIEAYGLQDDYGSCFKTADRTTDCRISCIHLWKPKSGAAEFEDYFDNTPQEEYYGGPGLMPYNAIRDIVNRYVGAVSRYESVMAASKEVNDLASVFSGSRIRFGAYKTSGNNYEPISYTTYKNELQKAAWLEIFNRMDMKRYVTQGVREDINRFVERQQHVPFTMRNIFKMLEIVVGTHGQRMQRTLVEAFDKICSFSAENSTAGEKWKTNSDYMINRRFIVPYITESDCYGSAYSHVNLRSFSGHPADIEDVIRALCYVTGTPYENTCNLRDFVDHNRLEWGKWYEMGKDVKRNDGSVEHFPGLFRIRGYKKGTMHFEFLDEDVWAKFNMEVAKIKGWQLPKGRPHRGSKSK